MCCQPHRCARVIPRSLRDDAGPLSLVQRGEIQYGYPQQVPWSPSCTWLSVGAMMGSHWHRHKNSQDALLKHHCQPPVCENLSWCGSEQKKGSVQTILNPEARLISFAAFLFLDGGEPEPWHVLAGPGP
ncbi:hypothetical protein AAFF_G00334870 [Aldrovandia affinis]|uniref:Uncharacterized protein n=1 Tax=Aldrovandia affinis TaxID=143900 RepID=A0AAD7WQI2_9TELE|nr:hypothetical protein AAFF_G00334870 [Aldrovandia affinis]